jgi:hypothetical protein
MRVACISVHQTEPTDPIGVSVHFEDNSNLSIAFPSKVVPRTFHVRDDTVQVSFHNEEGPNCGSMTGFFNVTRIVTDDDVAVDVRGAVDLHMTHCQMGLPGFTDGTLELQGSF